MDLAAHLTVQYRLLSREKSIQFEQAHRWLAGSGGLLIALAIEEYVRI